MASSDHNSPQATTERRHFDRFSTRLAAATIREDLPTKRAPVLRLELQDYSLGGLGGESPVRLKPNERVRLRLGADEGRAPVELTGRVRHCRRREDRYQVGIEFYQAERDAATAYWRHLPRLFCLAYQGPECQPLSAMTSRA